MRDETEFRYRGDATVARPAADAPLAEFSAYVYQRANPCGWHREWWLHHAGCRTLFQVERHTLTHELREAGTGAAAGGGAVGSDAFTSDAPATPPGGAR